MPSKREICSFTYICAHVCVCALKVQALTLSVETRYVLSRCYHGREDYTPRHPLESSHPAATDSQWESPGKSLVHLLGPEADVEFELLVKM